MSDRTSSTASRENSAREELTVLLAVAEKQKVHFERLLPSEIPWDVFKDTFKLAIQRAPYLMEADRDSLWQSLQKCAIDGLKPDGREAALVVFGLDEEDADGNKVATRGPKKKSVVYMPMTRGLIRLVRNSGTVANIDVELVFKGEQIEITHADGERHYRHVRSTDPNFDDSPDMVIGAYAVIKYKDETWEFEWMSRHQLDAVRAVSRAKSGPWSGPFRGEMYRKTVLRRICKRVDQSPVRRLDAALDRDETMTVEGVIESSSPLTPQRAIAAPAATPVRTTSQPEPEPANPIAGAATPPVGAGDRQSARGDANSTGNGASDPGNDAKPAAPDLTRPPQTSGLTSPGGEQPGNLAPGKDQPVEAWFPTDDIGEPVEIPGGAEAFTSATEFAGWLCTAMDLTTRPDALWENNLDATEELKAKWPDLFAEVYARYAAADQRVTKAEAAALAAQQRAQDQPPASEPDAAADEGGEPAGPPALKVPLTAAGKVSWPQYATTARKELDALSTQADVSAWVNRNFPTYHGKAIEAAIDKHVRETRARIDADKRVVQQTVDAPATEQSQPQQATDRDAATAGDWLKEIAALPSLSAHMEFVAGGAYKAKMSRWDRERRDLHDAISDAVAAKHVALRGGVS